MSKNPIVNVNMNIAGLLLVALIILKLCNIVTISWLWVFSPLWIPLGLVLVFLIIAAIGVLIVECCGKK